MKIIYFTLIESILFLTVAYYLGQIIKIKTNNTFLVIGNYALWIAIVILSILINFKKYLYFLSFFIITILVTIFALIKVNVKKYFKDNLYLSVYLLSGISFIAILNFVITKYFIYNIINTDAPLGDKGERGLIGDNGKSYFTETYSEKCYVEVIKHLENTYEEIKKSNDISFNTKDYHINNMYIKDSIKRICYSNQFLDNFYKRTKIHNQSECNMIYNTDNSTRGRYCINNSIIGNQCEIDEDCIKYEDNDAKYIRILNKIKTEAAGKDTSWLELILSNNCKQNINLRNKLGGSSYESLDTLNNNQEFDQNFKYNNKIGHEFLNDHFSNDKYWAKHLTKKINTNPFDTIKKSAIWNWGL
jgi:hypothetical protein